MIDKNSEVLVYTLAYKMLLESLIKSLWDIYNLYRKVVV